MPDPIPQAAAVAWRLADTGEVEVLLVTTTGGRWTAPKGTVEEGHTPEQTARVEALEEAGVIGVIAERELGSYVMEKEGAVVGVRVFSLRVERLLDNWQEKDMRERRWFPAAEAAETVANPDLGRLILSFARSVARAKAPGRKRA